jgi:hypothetical protein
MPLPYKHRLFVGAGLQHVHSVSYGKQGTSQHEHACYLLQAAFLLRFFFDNEDEGDMFLRNIG